MPRERQDFFRDSDSLEKEIIIVLAFEGNIAEEEYFEGLKADEKFNEVLIHLHLLLRPQNDTNSAPKHVLSKIKKEAKDKYQFNKKDELWMVIDTDRWNIPEIFNACKNENNVHVAVSNPCFEFWLLMHVKDFSKISADEKSKLLKNGRESNTKNYIDKYLGSIIGGYNKANPRHERFLPHIVKAITQSKTLDLEKEQFPSGLGSHVYKIAEKIIK